MIDPRISYAPRPDVTSEGEKWALAAVYKFVLDCNAKKKGGTRTAPDDAKEIKNVRAKSILPN
jgi:hypothetical protein